MLIAIQVSGRSGRNPLTFSWFVRRALEGMVIVNRAQIKAGEVGPLYASGVRYRDEPPGTETFRDAYTINRLGHGDCAHLAAWRVAELQEQGEKSNIRVKWFKRKPGRGRLYHIQVRRGNGKIEDPSKLLGMGT